ncbi:MULTISPECIES: 6,7-dimethyl-8-ribityllumazine synthase [unclassified Enterococcus]|uniref:6,7-dimethyl-8-ribityllumazine synthase n=1 Tax=unclassified Enterococcus TaxID=2608891 RepID=UPI00259AEE8A|nr:MULTISPECIES: 6,7-dimethyl-8-ribityllumazine synthase [unclassified Enterococcus]MDO0920230.1 6,7-dimethyl-8-ribityllumazine synthase [Enterococcus sp. B1E2]WIV15351.1 6,7-dimethyl-8-ribityllumazine synthase [Enterococcus sp. FZMF]
MTVFEGTFQGEAVKVGIVVSRFNEFITSKLVEGAKDNLLRHGVKAENIDVYWVPGAYEIPYIIKQIVDHKQYDGIVTLGALIRGATTHYELISNEVAKGVAQIGLNADIPIMFGVLTTETIEQAIERAGTKAGNKGSEAAQGLLEMISLNQQILGNV